MYYWYVEDHFLLIKFQVLLLQNRDLLPHPTQKLAAIFLLYEMYRTDPIAANPFATVFVHLLVSVHLLCICFTISIW